jgi:hypothetical protein
MQPTTNPQPCIEVCVRLFYSLLVSNSGHKLITTHYWLLSFITPKLVFPRSLLLFKILLPLLRHVQEVENICQTLDVKLTNKIKPTIVQVIKSNT